MNIHEYQAKQLFRDAGVNVVDGAHCTTVDEAMTAYAELGGDIVAVKSQIHAGGRGKGRLLDPLNGELVMEGGVKIATSEEQVREYATNILGNVLVTKQTGPAGKVVNNIYVEAGCDIAHEYYLAILVDRERKCVLIMASTEGGMNIEEVAERTPEALYRVHIDPSAGLLGFQKRNLGTALGLTGAALKSFFGLIGTLYELFIEADCSMIEINPLVRTKTDEIVALDAKVGFDDNAAFRHRTVRAALRDRSEEDEAETAASEAGLSYVNLDGEIGCLVNGAGLAMATMDVIKLYGGEPANFLDVGGGATAEQVTEGFRIILSDPEVEAIFVNIFGGIMRCDFIAEGIIAAAREVEIGVPLVVRLEGTNVELGRRMLDESGLALITASDMDDGARKAISAAGGA